MTSVPPAVENETTPQSPHVAWARIVGWFVACPILGIVIARLSLDVQTVFAPMLLFPVLAGMVVGAGCWAAMKLLTFQNRASLLAGTVLAVVALTVGQHYFSFRWAQARAMDQEAQNARLALQKMGATLGPSPPADVLDFLMKEAERGRVLGGYRLTGVWVWLSWGLEAGLSLLAALVVMIGVTHHRPDSVVEAPTSAANSP